MEADTPADLRSHLGSGPGSGGRPDRPAAPDPLPDLDRLSAGTLDWLCRNLDWFDPYSAAAGSSPHGKAKAALELALLRHCWSRLDTRDDPRLGRVTALVRTLWRHPDFPRLLTAEPAYAPQYALVCAALAPDRTGDAHDAPYRTALALLTADDLSPRGKSPYQRLETRYYADKAGVAHTIEPYRELAERNVLVTLPAAAARHERERERERKREQGREQEQERGGGRAVGDAPVTVPEAYAVTHSSFYLSDFGRTAPALSADALTAASGLVRLLLEHCVRRDWWDLAAELVMTQVCLGTEPPATPWGAAAVACLARAQRPDGAIPGRSPGTSASPAEPAGAFFAKAYHTTLVTALMSLLLTSPAPAS